MTIRILFLATLMLALPAFGGPVSLGVWYEFAFDVVGAPAFGCTPEPATGPCAPSDLGNTVYADPPPWTFTLPRGGTLRVTDAFRYGDAFMVFDFGSLVLTTPPVAISLNGCGSDPDFCYEDPESSHNSVFLAAGSHSITITPYQMAPEIGAAYFRVDDVPEPGTSAMMAIGVVLVAVRMRRR